MASNSKDVRVDFVVAFGYYEVHVNGEHIEEIEPSEDVFEAAEKFLEWLRRPVPL